METNTSLLWALISIVWIGIGSIILILGFISNKIYEHTTTKKKDAYPNFVQILVVIFWPLEILNFIFIQDN